MSASKSKSWSLTSQPSTEWWVKSRNPSGASTCANPTSTLKGASTRTSASTWCSRAVQKRCASSIGWSGKADFSLRLGLTKTLRCQAWTRQRSIQFANGFTMSCFARSRSKTPHLSLRWSRPSPILRVPMLTRLINQVNQKVTIQTSNQIRRLTSGGALK